VRSRGLLFHLSRVDLEIFQMLRPIRVCFNRKEPASDAFIR
jgi:hypothetical protein